MKSCITALALLLIGSGYPRAQADDLASNSTNTAAEIMGGYSPVETNGHPTFVEPTEFWCGPWKEGANGWRVQLRVYNRTNSRFIEGVALPVSTNLMLSVEWGSPTKNSGDGYFQAPNGKFAKFELLDAKGNIVPPMPNAGRMALAKWSNGTRDPGRGLSYNSELPAEEGSLVGVFPKTITTNVYPRFPDTWKMAGEIRSFSNRPPTYISLLPLDRIYFVANEGDYTLTVQPVLYKQRSLPDDGILDRVDLPSVTTKVHLAPVTRRMGGYSVMRGTNGYWIFTNPGEFWNGVWKEDTNDWRVQLRINSQTNYWFPQEEVSYPASTNLMLWVEWGSAVKDSGGGYYMSPNGKFAQFELKDAQGKVVSPNPDAGTNLLERMLTGRGFTSFPDIPRKLVYQSDLPEWASPATGSLVGNFPKSISSSVYPHIVYGRDEKSIDRIVGEILSVTNRPPSIVSFLKLDEIYSVTNAGDYTLTVQPVLYKKQTGTNVLDRVDLPSVTTKVHLVPSEK